MDNEFRVLNSVSMNTELTQRDIAKQTGLSLGTINILLKKMIREGLIKLELIPSDRLAYMLTPKGIDEKARKIAAYIQIHYNAINNTRIQLAIILGPIIDNGDQLVLDINQTEILDMVKQILNEKNKAFTIAKDGCTFAKTTIIADYNRPDELTDGMNWINIMSGLTIS